MDKYYTLSEIARMLSKMKSGRFFTEDSVWGWVRKGELQTERVPPYVQSWGRYPYWTDEAHLRGVLESKGYDVESIFE